MHRAAFELARALGPRAAFVLDELAWFLRPPLSKKDPRPLATLQTGARARRSGGAIVARLTIERSRSGNLAAARKSISHARRAIETYYLTNPCQPGGRA